MSGITDFVMMKVLEAEHVEDRGVSNVEVVGTLFPKMTRNMSVRLLAPELARIDAVVSVLDVSKTEFVLESLRDACDTACKVFEERGRIGAYESAYTEALREAGFQWVDDGKGGKTLQPIGSDEVAA